MVWGNGSFPRSFSRNHGPFHRLKWYISCLKWTISYIKCTISPRPFPRSFSPDPLLAQIWYSSGPLTGRPNAQNALYCNVSERLAGSEGTQFWPSSGPTDHFSRPFPQMAQTIFPTGRTILPRLKWSILPRGNGTFPA